MMPVPRHHGRRRPVPQRQQQILRPGAAAAAPNRPSRRARNVKQRSKSQQCQPRPGHRLSPRYRRCKAHPACRCAPLRPAGTRGPAGRRTQPETPAMLQSVPWAGGRTRWLARLNYEGRKLDCPEPDLAETLQCDRAGEPRNTKCYKMNSWLRPPAKGWKPISLIIH